MIELKLNADNMENQLYQYFQALLLEVKNTYEDRS